MKRGRFIQLVVALTFKYWSNSEDLPSLFFGSSTVTVIFQVSAVRAIDLNTYIFASSIQSRSSSPSSGPPGPP